MRVYTRGMKDSRRSPRKEVSDLKRTSLSLSGNLWRAVKIKAIHEGRDAQDLVAEALERYLRRAKKGSKADGDEG